MLRVIVLFFCTTIFSAHIVAQTKTDSTLQKSSETKENKGAVLDGKLFKTDKNIKAIKDSLDIKDLLDLPEAAELDKKWLEELYNNSLFDTIYKSVSEMTYKHVDYPELSTDTLKARLER